MTIGLSSDDPTFEQIKKQLNRCVEVIKVIDLTRIPFHAKEIMFISLEECSQQEIAEAFKMAEVYQIKIIHFGADSVLFECLQTEEENNELLLIMKERFHKLNVVRGGSVAIEKR
jgi:acetolactate synthase-1/3 small subunit